MGGAVNVLIRPGSPVENTQRYLYILLEKAPHCAPGVRVRRRTLVFSNHFPLSDETGRHFSSRGQKKKEKNSRSPVHDQNSENICRLSRTTNKFTPFLIQNLPHSCFECLKLHFKCDRIVKIHM